MIFLLFFLFVILLFFSFIAFDRDYMAPPFVFCSVYVISIGGAILNYVKWGLKDYSVEAFIILLSGALLFIIIGFLVKKVLFNRVPINYQEIEESPRINENIIISTILIIMNIVILFLTVKAVKTIGGEGSWGEMMENFRNISSYTMDPIQNIPGYLQQLQKIPVVCAYIYSFILIYNITANKALKKDYILAGINILIYTLMSLMLSNRLNILAIVGTILLFYLVLHQGSSQSNGLKTLFKIFIIFLFLMIIFYLIRLLVGRLNSANKSFMDYITFYISGPIKLFDLFLKDPIHDSTIWGKETFVSLVGTLRDLGANIPLYLQHKEFRTYNGVELGNVYSAYRNWFADFNLTGTFLLQALFSLFYNLYYYKIQKMDINKHKILFIIYGYMAEGLFLHPIDDWLFSMYFSVGMIIYIILFIVLYLAITKKVKF